MDNKALRVDGQTAPRWCCPIPRPPTPMLRNLWTSLFGEGKSNVAVTPQNAKTICNKDSSTEAPISAPSLDDEINVLARHFGGIVSGNTYEIELRELLSICPRQRKRADAYYLLKKLLKDRFNVDLVITSRTNKSTVNHEKED